MQFPRLVFLHLQLHSCWPWEPLSGGFSVGQISFGITYPVFCFFWRQTPWVRRLKIRLIAGLVPNPDTTLPDLDTVLGLGLGHFFTSHWFCRVAGARVVTQPRGLLEFLLLFQTRRYLEQSNVACSLRCATAPKWGQRLKGQFTRKLPSAAYTERTGGHVWLAQRGTRAGTTVYKTLNTWAADLCPLLLVQTSLNNCAMTGIAATEDICAKGDWIFGSGTAEGLPMPPWTKWKLGWCWTVWMWAWSWKPD